MYSQSSLDDQFYDTVIPCIYEYFINKTTLEINVKI